MAKRRTVTLSLPGDEDQTLDYMIRLAVRRDGKLNWLEWKARAIAYGCAHVSNLIGGGWCSYRYPGWKCDDCKELD